MSGIVSLYMDAGGKTLQQDQDALWQAVLGEIELSVSHGNFITWFKGTSLLEHSDEKIVIGVTNVFIKQTLENKYGDVIAEVLAKNGLVAKQVEFRAVSAQADRRRSDKSTQPALPSPAPSTVASGRTGQTGISGGLSQSFRPGLNERYTLDNFVVGDSNDVAFAACQAVTAQPGTKYNPLFIYGGVGIGKTHLLQAVGNSLRARDPSAKVLYISMEQFVQEFVNALRLRKMPAFAKHYRSADTLLVDDVQFIAGKEKIQEEFFHTFNALHQANKQIVITADKPPKDIPTLEDRLRSRFNGGMSIDMQIPDFETRCAIVQAKAQSHGNNLDHEVVEYLATNIQTNIRELEGALNQLMAYCEVRGLEPNLVIASGLINVSKTRPKHLSAKQIIERTARHFQIPFEEIIGPKRDKDIVVPRQVAMYMLRNELKLSFPKIARELGRKDHTTAIHSVDKIDREARSDASLRMAISEIREHLYA